MGYVGASMRALAVMDLLPHVRHMCRQRCTGTWAGDVIICSAHNRNSCSIAIQHVLVLMQMREHAVSEQNGLENDRRVFIQVR